MYGKLRKYYPSDKANQSGLTIEELEGIAEEIRFLIVGSEGVTMPEYIKRASEIPLIKLGHRRIYSIKKELTLEAYFPLAVWNILKERCDKVKSSRLTEDDNRFIAEHKGRGFKWLSERMYVILRNLSRKSKQIGVEIAHSNFDYTPSVVQFIKDHAQYGAGWIANKLGIDSDAIYSKCKRDGIVLKTKKVHIYTPDDDKFIKQNADKGSQWLAQQLHVTRRSITTRAKVIDVNITVFQNDMVKHFSLKEDEFIKKHLDKGAIWIAKKLGRRVVAIANRAKYMGWQFAHTTHHFYTKEENQFIKDNSKKGAEYLAEIFHVTPMALQKHAEHIGISMMLKGEQTDEER